MGSRANRLRQLIIVVYLVALHIVLAYFLGKEVLERYFLDNRLAVASAEDPTGTTVVPTPLPVPSVMADLPDPNANLSVLGEEYGALDLIVPVAGVRPEVLVDSYQDARSNERVHDAIDIAAPLGTPVVAATDGVIARFFDSEAGGITIYQWTRDRKYVLYYAHLQKRADNIKVGDTVVRGQTIGYVGDTGNAGPGNFHLHFSVALVRDPDRYWEGDYVNPYPLLRKSVR